MGLFPETSVLKDFFNHIRLVNEADDPHLPLALGAGKRVCFIDFPDKVGPSFVFNARLLYLLSLGCGAYTCLENPHGSEHGRLLRIVATPSGYRTAVDIRGLICGLLFVASLSVGCATKLSVQPASELTRFAAIGGIPVLDIPPLYQATQLRVGSMVTLEESGWLKTFRVVSIESDRYVIELLLIGTGSGTTKYLIEVDKTALSRVLVTDQAKIIQIPLTGEVPGPSAPTPAAVARGFLFGGLFGALINAADEVFRAPVQGHRWNSRLEDEAERFNEASQQTTTKIIDAKFVGWEDVDVSGDLKRCSVWEFRTLSSRRVQGHERGPTFRYVLPRGDVVPRGAPGAMSGQHISKEPMIQEARIKVWLSDEVPLGVAREEITRVIDFGPPTGRTEASESYTVKSLKY